MIFLQEGGARGVKKVCFCYILANTSKKYPKLRQNVNYNEKLNIFQKLPSRIYDPRFSKKKHLFHILIFYRGYLLRFSTYQHQFFEIYHLRGSFEANYSTDFKKSQKWTKKIVYTSGTTTKILFFIIFIIFFYFPQKYPFIFKNILKYFKNILKYC